MGSHFHNWTDYNGVTFLVVTRMGSHFHNRTDYNGVTFLVEFGVENLRDFWDKKILVSRSVFKNRNIRGKKWFLLLF